MFTNNFVNIYYLFVKSINIYLNNPGPPWFCIRKMLKYTEINFRKAGVIFMTSKRVEDSLTEQTYLVMHRHINGYGRLFGGQLLSWIDELAGIVAKRHSESEITTACIDQLHFKHPVCLNDTLVMIGRITYVGKTSMEVRIDSYVESLDGMRRLINRAYLVMVAIDIETGKAKQVPGLILETEVQKAEWEGGKRRTDLRKQRKIEGY